MKRVALLLAGLVLVAPQVAGAAGDQDPSPAGDGYRVGAGDVLAVETFGREEISGKVGVEPSGAITFPLLGSVPVAGKTPAEIAALLEMLLERDFYVDVQLKVEIAVYGSQPVTLLGEVQSPGTYFLQGPTTLTELLSRAGGLKSTAGPVLELRRVTRVGAEGPAAPMTFPTAGIASGEVGREVFLESGDVLSVPARQLYFVTGEIARPGQYEISPGLTLMQAVSQAGGVGKFASQAVEIHRIAGGDKEILSFDLAQIRKGREVDPAIEAGDVIFIKRRFF